MSKKPFFSMTEQYWQSHLDAQRTSGLNAHKYCLRHQLDPSSFYQWRRRLAKASPPAGFREITPLVCSPARSATIQLHHTCGCTLDIPQEFDSDTLARILSVLEQRRS